MPNYLTRQQIIEKIPKLKRGSFDHWVIMKAGVKPIGTVRMGHLIAFAYPTNCISKIKAVMGVE